MPSRTTSFFLHRTLEAFLQSEQRGAIPQRELRPRESKCGTAQRLLICNVYCSQGHRGYTVLHSLEQRIQCTVGESISSRREKRKRTAGFSTSVCDAPQKG